MSMSLPGFGRRDERVDGQRDMKEEDSEHNNGNSESGFCHLAIMLIVLMEDNIAALCNVPSYRARVLRV